MHKFTVVIPIYNTSEYLNECLNSVFNQTYDNLEIIAIDDGSTDDSLKVLSSFKDPRLTVIHQNNQGVASSRNKGIDNATGDYIKFLDSDDSISLNFFEEANICLNKFPKFTPISRLVNKRNNKLDNIPSFKDEFEVYSGITPWAIHNQIFNLKTIKDNRIYFRNCNHYEDAMFSNEYLGFTNCKYMWMNNSFYYYTADRQTSLCHNEADNNNQKRLKDSLPWIKDHISFCKENNFKSPCIITANKILSETLKRIKS